MIFTDLKKNEKKLPSLKHPNINSIPNNKQTGDDTKQNNFPHLIMQLNITIIQQTKPWNGKLHKGEKNKVRWVETLQEEERSWPRCRRGSSLTVRKSNRDWGHADKWEEKYKQYKKVMRMRVQGSDEDKCRDTRKWCQRMHDEHKWWGRMQDIKASGVWEYNKNTSKNIGRICLLIWAHPPNMDSSFLLWGILEFVYWSFFPWSS